MVKRKRRLHAAPEAAAEPAPAAAPPRKKRRVAVLRAATAPPAAAAPAPPEAPAQPSAPRRKKKKRPLAVPAPAAPAPPAAGKARVRSPAAPPVSPNLTASQAQAHLLKPAPRSILKRRAEPPAPPAPPAPAAAPAPTHQKKKKKRKSGGAAPGAQGAGPQRGGRRASPAAAPAPAPPAPAPAPAESTTQMLIVAGTYDSALAGWTLDTATGAVRPRFAMRSHIGYVSAVAVNRKWVVSAGSDEVIGIYNARRLRQVGDCASEGTCSRIILMQKHLLVATTTGMVEVFQCKDWQTVWKEKGHKKGIDCIALHPNGRAGLTVSPDGFLKVWDFAKAKLAVQIKQDRPCTLVEYSPDGSSFVTFAHPVIAALSGADARVLCKVESLQEVHCMAFLGPTHLLCGREDGKLDVWHFSKDGAAAHVATHDAHRGRVRGLSVVRSASATYAVTACSGGQLRVWSWAEAAPGALQPRAQVESQARFTCVDADWHHPEQ